MQELICQCPFCGKITVLQLTDEEERNYKSWRRREMLIQDAFPHRSANERELIKTGICQRCWDEMFGGE